MSQTMILRLLTINYKGLTAKDLTTQLDLASATIYTQLKTLRKNKEIEIIFVKPRIYRRINAIYICAECNKEVKDDRLEEGDRSEFRVFIKKELEFAHNSCLPRILNPVYN